MNDSTMDLWNRLSGAKTDEPPKLYPGNTPPREHTLDKPTDDWLSSLPSQEYMVGGEKKKFYSIGTLSAVLQRSTTTVRSWEAKGWLPSASFRTPPPRKPQIPGKPSKGKRLYSEKQLRFLYEAYVRFYLADPKKADWAGFRRHIKQQYPTN
jgi:hypothetical protein